MLTKEKSSQNSENTIILHITPYRFPRYTLGIPVTYHLKEAENIVCAASGLSLRLLRFATFFASQNHLIIQAVSSRRLFHVMFDVK